MSTALDKLPEWARTELLALRQRVEELDPFAGRKLRKFKEHLTHCAKNYGNLYCSCPDHDAATAEDADLVCSDLPGQPEPDDWFGPGPKHKPVIDIDLPCRLIESGTPGHFHLYIDAEVEGSSYWRMLHAMADAGVVEPGFVSASMKRGYSAVRHPDKPKVQS